MNVNYTTAVTEYYALKIIIGTLPEGPSSQTSLFLDCILIHPVAILSLT